MSFPRKTQNLSALERPGGFDVCIVGSGPPGTLLGTTLSSRGVQTLILESGTGKTLVAERDLDIEILKEVAAKKW